MNFRFLATQNIM